MKIKKHNFIILISLNFIIVIAMLCITLSYFDNNKKELKRNNMEEALIATQSIADALDVYIKGQQDHLLARKHYIMNVDNVNQYDSAVNFLKNSCNNELYIYHLLDENYKGKEISYFGKTDLEYTHIDEYPEMKEIMNNIVNGTINDDVINSSTAFSDPEDADLEYVAFYTSVTLIKNDVEADYALLSLVEVHKLLGEIIPTPRFTGSAYAIIDNDGNYISKNTDGVESNFLEFLYNHSGMLYPKQRETIQYIRDNNDGVITIKEKDEQEYVFAFSKITNSNSWYYITRVPMSNIKSITYDYSMLAIITVFFIAILVTNFTFIGLLNRRLKSSLVSTEEAIFEARKANSAKTTFLSRMSHEIRTPLNAVTGYLTIMRGNLENPDRLIDCITKADISAKHLLSIINDVLDISKIECGKIHIASAAFDFKNLITSTSDMFHTLANNKDIKFEMQFENETDTVLLGDEIRINQILINLLNNAIKFTNPGGHVKFSVHANNVDDENCEITFIISDTGIGMKPEFIKKIWEPFEQADESISYRFGGTGLGLSITKALVDMMGGEINIASTLGKGSTFTVKLKFGRLNKFYEPSTYDFFDLFVLVVGEDINTCKYIETLLKGLHVRCSICTNHNLALAMLNSAENDGDPFNICLFDMPTPEESTLSLIQKIKTTTSNHIPAIIVSTSDCSKYEKEILNAGANKTIPTPLLPSTLLNLFVTLKHAKIVNISKHNFHLTGMPVLLVEDNDMNIEIATSILQMAGVIVKIAHDGEEAVRLFTNSPEGTFKAILMDIQLPNMNGYTATKLIRLSNHPDAKKIKIFAMTANAFDSDVAESNRVGMNGHINKPIDANVLYKILNDVLYN